MVAVGEAAQIAQRSQDGLRARYIHARQRDQQLNSRILASQPEERPVYLGDGLLKLVEQMQVASKCGSTIRVDLQLIEPLAPALVEEAPRRWRDQALVE